MGKCPGSHICLCHCVPFHGGACLWQRTFFSSVLQIAKQSYWTRTTKMMMASVGRTAHENFSIIGHRHLTRTAKWTFRTFFHDAHTYIFILSGYGLGHHNNQNHFNWTEFSLFTSHIPFWKSIVTAVPAYHSPPSDGAFWLFHHTGTRRAC